MRHFFPGKDLAPPRPPGWHKAAASAEAARARESRGTPGKGRKRGSLYSLVKAKGRGVAKGAQAREGSGGRHFPVVKAPNFGSTAEAARRAAMLLHGPPRRNEAAPPSEVDQRVATAGAGTGKRGKGAQNEGVGVATESELHADPLANEGGVSPRSNFGQLLRRATRGEGEESKARDTAQEVAEEKVDREENTDKYTEKGKENGQEGEGKKEGKSGENEEEEEDEENTTGGERLPSPPPAYDARMHRRETRFDETVEPAPKPPLSLSSRANPATRHGAAGCVVGQSNFSESVHTSVVGDNFSTTQLRKMGTLTVYVPHSPNPGVWAASVDYDAERDVAWVLAEALRMYRTEHSSVARYTGLAPRPRRLQRSPTFWGLFQGNSREWEEVTPLPLDSSVLSALRPGQELVVLVDGFDPAAAFSRRPSVVALPPPPEAEPPAAAILTHPGDDCGDSARCLPPSPPLPEYGRGGAPGRDDTASDASRAPSDGARRFRRHDSAERDTSVPPSRGRDTCARGDGFGRDGVDAYRGGCMDVPRGGVAPETATAPGRNWAQISEIESSDEDEGGSDSDDEDSLTEEEDGEETLDDYCTNHFPRHQEPYGSSRPLDGRDRLGGVTEASVSTRGLAERCEDDGHGAGGSQQPAGGAPEREHRGQQPIEGGFPQPRSPPRSLVSAMFTAWGDS